MKNTIDNILRHPIAEGLALCAAPIVMFIIVLGLVSCVQEKQDVVEAIAEPNSATQCQKNLVYFKDDYGNCFAACEWNVWMEYGGQGLTTIPCDKMPPDATIH